MLLQRPWYERPTPVFAVILAMAFAGFVLTVAWNTARYYRDFKSGKPVDIPQYTSRFTPGAFAAAAHKNSSSTDVVSADAPTLGNPGAKVTIVEFGDFECPYTKEVYPTIRAIAAERPKDVRVLWRDFPLETVHPNSRAAAAAASCAGRQGKFWQMYDKLFLNQNALARADLVAYAGQIGLDAGTFTACLDAGGDKERIERDIAAGLAAGVHGTPTFFVNGVKVEGAIPYDILSKVVAKLAE